MATSDALDRRPGRGSAAGAAPSGERSASRSRAAIFLVLLVAGAVLGPWLLEELATRPQLRMRNAPPFTLEHGWSYILGADSLGRQHPRPPPGRRPQHAHASPRRRSSIAMVFGAALGLLAGFTRSWYGDLVMRLTDIVMSFPSTLLAVVILYTFRPSIATLVAVLAITRLPIYIRTTRAEVLEIRERMFVSAARVMGASPLRIALRHVLPMVLPTLLTIATVEFAIVMLAESGLSFLGIGIQPPEVTWGRWWRRAAAISPPRGGWRLQYQPIPSEYGLRRHIEGLLAQNRTCEQNVSFLGGGCWQHYVPSVCKTIMERDEFLTAYVGEAFADHGKFQAQFSRQAAWASCWTWTWSTRRPTTGRWRLPRRSGWPPGSPAAGRPSWQGRSRPSASRASATTPRRSCRPSRSRPVIR